MGDLSGARVELEALFADWSPSQQSDTIYLVHDRHFRAGIALARTPLDAGHPTRAVERAREFIDGATRMDHPASVTVLLRLGRVYLHGPGIFAVPRVYRRLHRDLQILFPWPARAAVGRARRPNWPSAGVRTPSWTFERPWPKFTPSVTS